MAMVFNYNNCQLSESFFRYPGTTFHISSSISDGLNINSLILLIVTINRDLYLCCKEGWRNSGRSVRWLEVSMP